ncbi:MAG: hypothetical protein ACO3VG_03230 [Nitriliruptoraceae bacterium]
MPMGHDGTHLLVGCYGIQTDDPGHAVRIAMSDLAPDGTLALDERQLATGTFDGTHSYFGDLGGTVVKVAMAGPTLAQRVDLNS